MNEKGDCSQLAPYLLSTGSFTFTFLVLCLPRGSERKHHCLISDPRTLSQFLSHHHKGGASPGITLHILPHCTEGSPQSASHWACLCLTQNIWSHLRYSVLNILMSYLQLRLKLEKKGERDTFMSAFQFAELWINWASIMRLFFVKMKQARVQSVQCWIWGCTAAIWASNGSFSMDFGWTLSGQPKPSAATH